MIQEIRRTQQEDKNVDEDYEDAFVNSDGEDTDSDEDVQDKANQGQEENVTKLPRVRSDAILGDRDQYAPIQVDGNLSNALQSQNQVEQGKRVQTKRIS